MEDIIYIAVVWAFGVCTGMGIGHAIATQKAAQAYREWMALE